MKKSDDEQIEASIEKIVKETEDFLVFTGCSKNKKIFVKRQKTEKGKVMNDRELVNQKFLHKITQGKNTGFKFIVPVLVGNDLVYPDLNNHVDWLALSHETDIAPLASYEKQMFYFFDFCLEIDYMWLPKEIKEDAKERMSHVMTNFNNDIKFIVERGVINMLEGYKFRSLIEKGMHNRAFQHHDVVPWHMAKEKVSGEHILIDSGFSGWSLKYYDLSYYVLQMTGYAQRKKEALEFLNMAINHFRDDKEFFQTLATAMSYRGIRLIAELLRKGKDVNAQEVLGVVRDTI